MNAWRIALFAFLLQSAVLLAGFASIPIRCTADNSECIFFDENIIGTTTLSSIINGEAIDGQYKSTRIEQDLFTVETFTATAIAVDKAVSIMAFAATGIFSLVRFFFGWTILTFWMGVTLQSATHYFYIRTVISIIKEGKGDI